MRQAVEMLQRSLIEQKVPLRVVPGADVRIDERLPDLLDSDQAMTLADTGKYVLLELPHETFVDLSGFIETLAARNVRSVLSHPERHEALRGQPEALRPWLERGAVLQVTAASLTAPQPYARLSQQTSLRGAS